MAQNLFIESSVHSRLTTQAQRLRTRGPWSGPDVIEQPKSATRSSLQRMVSQPIACWRTLSGKKQTRLPSSDDAGELGVNRKGSWRPDCQWCFIEPVG